MKRQALLIGSSGGLQGVLVDIENMRAFLKSRTGGAWIDQEIEVLRSPSRASLISRVQQLKSTPPDYLVVLFTGHAGYERQTVLQINERETIGESELLNVGKRQLSIFDCCRVVTEQLKKAAELTAGLRFESVDATRQRYEARIMQAIPQQVQLYGCSKNEYSYDTRDGAIYLSNFLSAARATTTEFKTIEAAHTEARMKTIECTKEDPRGTQNPEAVFPKCLTAQQLIISMRA